MRKSRALFYKTKAKAWPHTHFPPVIFKCITPEDPATPSWPFDDCWAGEFYCFSNRQIALKTDIFKIQAFLERLHTLVQSPNSCDDQSWARAWTLNGECNPGLMYVAKPWLHELSHCLPRSVLTGSWNQELDPKVKLRLSDVECGCLHF